MQWLSRAARFWVPLLVVVMGLYLALNNRSSVHLILTPFVEEIELPAFMMYTGFFVGGAVMMMLANLPGNIRRGMQLRKLTKRLREVDPDFEATVPPGSAAAGQPPHRSSPPVEPFA